MYPTIQNMLMTYGFICDRLENDYIQNPTTSALFQNAARVALEKLSPYYGKTDKIPIYILASSKYIFTPLLMKFSFN
jgi:hypothetical protein